jgi:hypothetical protein
MNATFCHYGNGGIETRESQVCAPVLPLLLLLLRRLFKHKFFSLFSRSSAAHHQRVYENERSGNKIYSFS